MLQTNRPLTLVFLSILFFFTAIEAFAATTQLAPLKLSQDMITVIAILFLVIILFIFGDRWGVRVDMVAILMVIILPVSALMLDGANPYITGNEAISGFSSNAVISIIAVIIIGSGLDRTGVMHFAAKTIIKVAGKSESRVMAVISGTVAFLSSFMQNIGAATLFMPVVSRIGKQLKIQSSKLLMPMGFSAILGGTITLVGSSPLILLNDLMLLSNKSLKPFSLFDVTPVGLSIALCGILYFVVFNRYVLPKRQSEEKGNLMISPSIRDTYEDVCKIFELKIPDSFPEKSLLELQIKEKYQLTVVAISDSRTYHKNFAPVKEEKLSGGMDIVVAGDRDHAILLSSDFNWKLKDDIDVFAEDLSPEHTGMMEGIITPRSELIGRKMKDINFRKTYELIPVVLCREDKLLFGSIADTVLRSGDAILLFGRWESYHLVKEKNMFVFTTDVKGEVIKTEKTKVALFWLALSLALILGFNLQLSIALLIGALGMVMTRVLTIDEAYQSVDWRTIFLLAGLIPLGLAFQKTNTAEWLAASIISNLGNIPPVVFLSVVAVITSFFTLFISNVGATALLVPLAMNMAYQISPGDDSLARVSALAVALTASNTFLIPTHQVNALIMGPGGYRTMDYVRAGIGMTVLFIALTVSILYLFYLG
ncbi:MAG: SLC13 family permease [Spirochaetota bacterium]|nr:SLC13 family permease [Spirochaetota bacterium]